MIHRCNICARPTLPSFEFGVRICVAHGPLTWDAFRAHLERDLDSQAEMYRSGIAAQAKGIAFIAEQRLDRVQRLSGHALVGLYNRACGEALLYVRPSSDWIHVPKRNVGVR